VRADLNLKHSLPPKQSFWHPKVYATPGVSDKTDQGTFKAKEIRTRIRGTITYASVPPLWDEDIVARFGRDIWDCGTRVVHAVVREAAEGHPDTKVAVVLGTRKPNSNISSMETKANVGR
jgi:hypothetical protein